MPISPGCGGTVRRMTCASTKKLVKNIPDDLAHVLDRMLKKRVADRPQSAQEVLKELADRPLIAVPIAGIDEGAVAAAEGQHLAPGVVRTISAPQTFTPRGSSPAMSLGGATAAQKCCNEQARSTGQRHLLRVPNPLRRRSVRIGSIISWAGLTCFIRCVR